jgi:SAM-dependent methyltransferase
MGERTDLMAIVYDQNYFNNGGSIGGYTLYSATTYSSETAEQLATKFLEKSNLSGVNLVGKKVLVLGCAYGYLVKYLVDLGVDAYGIEISSYAISQAPAETSSRLLAADIRLESAFTSAKTMAGLTRPNDKFDLIIDEDTICCFTNAEAATVRTLALKYSSMFYHLIDTSPHLIQWYNWHSITEWKSLLGTSPKEKWYARWTWSEI